MVLVFLCLFVCVIFFVFCGLEVLFSCFVCRVLSGDHPHAVCQRLNEVSKSKCSI